MNASADPRERLMARLQDAALSAAWSPGFTAHPEAYAILWGAAGLYLDGHTVRATEVLDAPEVDRGAEAEPIFRDLLAAYWSIRESDVPRAAADLALALEPLQTVGADW